MSTSNVSVDHASCRLVISLPHLYDEARALYEALVPQVDYARFFQLATWQATLELAEINAPHGFMRYHRGDVTAIMAGSSSTWKATQYLMGNHTIAERMFRHDPSVMLHAPLRTVLYADAAGDTQLTIDQPSVLFDSYRNPEISSVGIELDHLVAQLILELGGKVPTELDAGSG